MAERAIADVRDLDVLVVPGGSSAAIMQVFERPQVLEWIRRMHQRTQWTKSMCTGSMILAQAGLLTGLRATTVRVIGCRPGPWSDPCDNRPWCLSVDLSATGSGRCLLPPDRRGVSR